jgi:hypothetical protein
VAATFAIGLGLSDNAGMLSLFLAPFEVAARILDAPSDQSPLGAVSNLLVFAAALAWTALFSILVYVRYATLKVTR